MLAFATVGIMLITLVGDIFRGVMPLENVLTHPFRSMLAFVTTVTAMSLFCYLTLQFFSWRIGPEGVTGRDSSGRRVALKWAEISHISYAYGAPFPAINICGIYGKKQIQAYVMGLNCEDVHANLLDYAGGDNPLTVSFRSAG